MEKFVYHPNMAYLSVVEMMIYVTAIGWESEPPCSAYLISGQIVPWLRYVEWLITCPVILIALSRVGQSEGGYSKNTMKLLTSDQGTIILGILAASSPDSAGQALFYLCGVAYGFTTFYTAAVVYFEAWQAIPDECRAILKSMIYFFYSGWLMFPILFIIGPEGAGHITPSGSTIGHVIADLLSKQMWSICEYMMENKLHILNLLAEEEEEEEEEGAVPMEGTPGSGKVLIVDNTMTVGPFYEASLKKMGADPTTVETVDNAMELLRQPLEEGDMQFDFLILSANDLHTPGLQELMDEIDMPLVAYAMDVAALDPTRTAIADDIIPTPIVGSINNTQALTMVWCKHSKTKAIVDSKDVVINQLFTQVTKLQEELDGRESGMDLQGGMEKSRKSNVSDMYQPSRNSSASHFGGVDAGGAQQIMGGMLQNNMQSPMMQQQNNMMGMQQANNMMGGGTPQQQGAGGAAFHFM